MKPQIVLPTLFAHGIAQSNAADGREDFTDHDEGKDFGGCDGITQAAHAIWSRAPMGPPMQSAGMFSRSAGCLLVTCGTD